MPKRSLELLDQSTSFFRNDSVNQLLDTVINVDAIRIFMAYPKPWWTSENVTGGRSTTDLPLRQFYYWLTSPSNGNSVVLASYANGQAEEFWHGLQSGPPFDDLKGSATDPAKRPDAAQGRGPRPATKTMAEMAHRYLMEVVGVTDAPEPYYAHFQNWTKDPWGAGWHAFRAGAL